MRFAVRLSLLSLPFLSSVVLAQEGAVQDKKQFGYQSDVARLRKIVINSLYSHRDVFLRELLSNSNDALEKLRITTLTDGTFFDEPLNVTIKAIPNEDGQGGRLVITDYGIGMTPEELTTNLGTLAKSGTSDFLSKAESDTSNAGNLIGQFGVGFYSAFLVSDQVYVASIPHPSKANPNPVQHVFSSSSEDSNFEIYTDPRGNTLGRGTEITLILKDDALEYLSTEKLKELVTKHSAFSTTYPVYLYTIKTEEVPEVTPADDEPLAEESTSPADPTAETTVEDPKETEAAEEDEDLDADEAVVEEVEETKEEIKEALPVMKNVTTEEWVRLNDQPPLWTRDPKNVTKQEYADFYMATFNDHNSALATHHFKGDSGSGVSFKALIFVPPNLDKEFWQSAKAATGSVKLFVKRVFITSDFGEAALPKWISWIRAIVDADDLPLNVSRETLQSGRFLAQIKQVIINRTISLLNKLSRDDPAQFKKIIDVYGPAFKLGAMETPKEQQKLAALVRWDTNTRKFISFDDYVSNRKKGQNQIFFLANAGAKTEDLAKSVFVEKLTARGYEVLLLHEPMDEILVANLRSWKGMTFQDAAKKGLKFGDEDAETAASEKAELAEQTERFKPLLKYLKDSANETVKEVVISNRLVTSPCAIVADQWGYSANMEKLMQSQTNPKETKDGQQYMHEWARKQKSLEINPRSPLIEGLLKKIQELGLGEELEEGEEPAEIDEEAEKEIKEVVSILIDGALVRSGFDVTDSNEFFARIDQVLRRSLGVSETAKADATVLPAPAVADEDDDDIPSVGSPIDDSEDILSHDEKLSDDIPRFEEQIHFGDGPSDGEIPTIHYDGESEAKVTLDHDEL